MKNKLFLIVIILIFSLFANIYAQEVKFGIQVGGGAASAFNYFPKKSDFTNDPDFVNKNLLVLSYSAGFYMSYPFSENYSIAVEPGFIQKGFAEQFIQNYDQTYNRTYLSYLHLPVLLEIQLESPFTLTIGPEIGYLLNAKLRENNVSGYSNIMHYYRKNKVDFGVQGGGYYSFSENFDLGLKLGTSLTNLEKSYIDIHDGAAFIEVRKKAVYMNVFTRYKF